MNLTHSKMIFKYKIFGAVLHDMMTDPISLIPTLATIWLFKFAPDFDGTPTIVIAIGYVGFMSALVWSKIEAVKFSQERRKLMESVRQKFEEGKITIQELDLFMDKHNK